MSRLEIDSPKRARIVMEGLYKDLERRIESSPPGLCPVDMARAFLELCHAQTCGKCVPCRIGLGQLNHFIKDVLDGKATMETLEIMEQTARSIMESADCAIGYEAANMVYKGLVGYRDDYIDIEYGQGERSNLEFVKQEYEKLKATKNPTEIPCTRPPVPQKPEAFSLPRGGSDSQAPELFHCRAEAAAGKRRILPAPPRSAHRPMLSAAMLCPSCRKRMAGSICSMRPSLMRTRQLGAWKSSRQSRPSSQSEAT